MELILSLLIIGVLLLGSEVFLTSGLIGTVGVACLLVGISMAASHYGVGAALTAAGCSLVATLVVIGVSLKILPRTRFGKTLVNQAASGGQAVNTGAATAPELIGKRGKAITTFAPTGLAEIDGKQYEAASLDGLLQVGEALVVAGRDSYKLLVKKAGAEPNAAS